NRSRSSVHSTRERARAPRAWRRPAVRDAPWNSPPSSGSVGNLFRLGVHWPSSVYVVRLRRTVEASPSQPELPRVNCCATRPPARGVAGARLRAVAPAVHRAYADHGDARVPQEQPRIPLAAGPCVTGEERPPGFRRRVLCGPRQVREQVAEILLRLAHAGALPVQDHETRADEDLQRMEVTMGPGQPAGRTADR